MLGAREQQTNKCKSQSPSCALYLSEWFCGWLKMPLVPLSILESGEFQATDLYQVPQDHPTIYGTSTWNQAPHRHSKLPLAWLSAARPSYWEAFLRWASGSQEPEELETQRKHNGNTVSLSKWDNHRGLSNYHGYLKVPLLIMDTFCLLSVDLSGSIS